MTATTWCNCGHSDVIHETENRDGRLNPGRCMAPGCTCPIFDKAKGADNGKADEQQQGGDHAGGCACGG